MLLIFKQISFYYIELTLKKLSANPKETGKRMPDRIKIVEK